MSVEQSKFQNQPKKLLHRVANTLIENVDWLSDNPYNTGFNDVYLELSNIGKYIGLNHINNIDVEFFFKFIEINEDKITKINEGDKSIIETLEIPIAEEYRVDYRIWGTCSFVEERYDNFTSYDKDWVEDGAHQLMSDSSWDYYDGVSVNVEYDNFDTSDYSFDEVYLAPKSNPNPSLKKINENSKKIIDSLDKKTLLELKKIIEYRLRVL